MKALPLRVVVFAASVLCGSLVAAGWARAEPTGEQDTTNGVAPTKAGQTEPGPSPIKPISPAASATASPHVPKEPTEAQRYCDNIAAVAAEARFAWQTRKLTELQSQVTEKVAELEKKQAELQASLARRDAAMKRAQETLIAIYAKMQPDAAAAQLSVLDDELAAAVLAQLGARQSSAILNEISPERAERLVGTMTSLPKDDKAEGKKS